MALWKYEIHVLDSSHTKEREDRIWEFGRGGWDLVSVVPGDWLNGNPQATDKMTWFMKREATHDINF